MGDPESLSFLYSGGMRLDLAFTGQALYELAKMDGAIIVKDNLSKIAYANVQLMPDPTISSDETGTRHRTAERVAKQTGALVISISQQRETVTIFQGRQRYQLDPVPTLLAKTNQALATSDTYRTRLEQVLTRLTALEFQNAVVLDDVLVVLQRAELTTRMAEEIERNCVELGTEGRLIRMRLTELLGDVPGQRAAIVNDYHVAGGGPEAVLALEGLAALSYQELLEFERIAELLGLPPDRESARPHGLGEGLPGAVEHPAAAAGGHPARRCGPGGAGSDRPRLAARPRSGARSRHRPGPRHPRRAPPPPGAQPGRPLSAALGRYEQGLLQKSGRFAGLLIHW